MALAHLSSMSGSWFINCILKIDRIHHHHRDLTGFVPSQLDRKNRIRCREGLPPISNYHSFEDFCGAGALSVLNPCPRLTLVALRIARAVANFEYKNGARAAAGCSSIAELDPECILTWENGWGGVYCFCYAL